MLFARAVARESARETCFRRPHRFETRDNESPREVPHEQALSETRTGQVRRARGMERHHTTTCAAFEGAAQGTLADALPTSSQPQTAAISVSPYGDVRHQSRFREDHRIGG